MLDIYMLSLSVIQPKVSHAVSAMHEIAVAALLSVRIGILRELERESEKAPPKVVNFDNALQILLVKQLLYRSFLFHLFHNQNVHFKVLFFVAISLARLRHSSSITWFFQAFSSRSRRRGDGDTKLSADS